MPNNPSPQEPKIHMEAINWLIRLRVPSFSEWDAFIAWLEASKENNAAYQAAAMLDEKLDMLVEARTNDPRLSVADARPAIAVAAASTPHLTHPSDAAPSFANDDQPVSRSRPNMGRRWLGVGIAAAVLAAIALPNMDILSGSQSRRIVTLAGSAETIALPDGSTIDLNGSSILELDKSRPRYARLESGEAMFHIVHQQKSPFIVESGGAKIVDLGTAFNVIRTENHLSIAVSEGVVLFNPDRDNVRMRAGEGLDAADDRIESAAKKKIDVVAVGGWRSGLLLYQDAPLSTVVADLKRTTGMAISVSADAADMSFRGALSIHSDGQRTIDDLAALSGTRVLKQGQGWMLSR